MSSNGYAAPQPGLRSYIVYSETPAGCLTHVVTSDRAAPHLRAGDVAIFDPTDLEPTQGEHFLVQWTSADRRDVVETRNELGGWCFTWEAAVAAIGDDTPLKVRWRDGPYRPEGIAQRILGRIVGILAQPPRA